MTVACQAHCALARAEGAIALDHFRSQQSLVQSQKAVWEKQAGRVSGELIGRDCSSEIAAKQLQGLLFVPLADEILNVVEPCHAMGFLYLLFFESQPG